MPEYECVQDLRSKLDDVYSEIKAEKIKEEESKFFGIFKFFDQIRSQSPFSSPSASNTDRQILKGEMATGESKDFSVNRENRRLDKKLTKRKTKKIDNSNP